MYWLDGWSVGWLCSVSVSLSFVLFFLSGYQHFSCTLTAWPRIFFRIERDSLFFLSMRKKALKSHKGLIFALLSVFFLCAWVCTLFVCLFHISEYQPFQRLRLQLQFASDRGMFWGLFSFELNYLPFGRRWRCAFYNFSRCDAVSIKMATALTGHRREQSTKCRCSPWSGIPADE